MVVVLPDRGRGGSRGDICPALLCLSRRGIAGLGGCDAGGVRFRSVGVVQNLAPVLGQLVYQVGYRHYLGDVHQPGIDAGVQARDTATAH